MKTEITATGKNIEQAIENALFELKATRDDVDIKILEEGGFFKKAKVTVSISEDALPRYEKHEQAKQEKSESFENALKDFEKPEVKTTAKVVLEEVEDQAERCRKFFEGLFESSMIGGEIEIEENDEEIFVKLVGKDCESFVGYRGEGINALQYLVSVYVGKNNRHAKKIRLNINDYREKREQTLINLAKRIADKVEKTKHSCKLEPMSANERRIIHTTLQDYENITTFSKGEEPHRFLTICFKNSEQTAQPVTEEVLDESTNDNNQVVETIEPTENTTNE